MSDRYLHGVFAEAPLVHPFRSPANHAQRLRALRFAREKQSRILWIVAYDKVVSKDELSQKAQSRENMESWLTLADRWTAGIPGFFPAVLDLPVRFTCEPTPGDRLKGVFTNARGWLRGWELKPEEEEIISRLPDAERALRERPVALYIEMTNTHPDLELIDGRPIYVLRNAWKPWYKDGDAKQVPIRRCGFPLAPDFGGTAHAFCGFSLDACIGDLLDWWDKPSRETAVRGYISNSRVRTTDKLKIARPYSPELFRLGPPAGPHYLLEVLRGNLTRQEAVKQWDAQEEKHAKESKATQQASRWPDYMRLPCRTCSDPTDMKTFRPLSAFTSTKVT